jgi:histidine decarboxylase
MALGAILVVLYVLTTPSTGAMAQSNTHGAAASALSLREVVKGAVGPFPSHSDGYGNPGASGLGYIAVVTLHTGQTPKEFAIPGQNGEGLDGTVAFDRAEANGAYMGQINLIVASSFIGLNGAIWGYDIAKAMDIAERKPFKLFEITESTAGRVPVYPADPLIDAASRLLGARDAPRFPLLPGAQVIAAHKEITAVGPTTVWCGIAIAIAENRDIDANAIMELCGELRGQSAGETEEQYFRLVRENLAKSVMRVGANQDVKYREIFVGVKHEFVPEGSVGYAMATAPYIVLAKGAVPPGGPEKLLEMNISDWEKALQRRPKREANPAISLPLDRKP